MTLTKDELRRLAITIRDEYRPGANTAYRVGSLLLAIINSLSDDDIETLSRHFLRKDLEDTAQQLIHFLQGIDVRGDSTFNGDLSSEDFVSGFLTGKGWAITKDELPNAAGIPEKKYTGEFDNLIVRNTLRVFEMIISQLLGENDNRVFTSMLEVDHYDPETGKVWLKTFDGRFYNPFRTGDYIMVKQYNGMPSEENSHYVTKHYELIVTSAGVGDTSLAEDRLDWVTFSHFVSSDGRSASEVIAAGDTFTRVDSDTDADRKGLIQLITVGSTTPYMDIVYGLKTDPDNALKGRLGNLAGIRHHLFGWLKGFGELLTNLYAVGDFRLRRTGESLDTKIEMLKGVFATLYQQLSYDLTEENNYLHNATFTENMDGWTADNQVSLLSSNGEAFLLNGSVSTITGRLAMIGNYNGRNMLHLRKSGIVQPNGLIRKPGTHKEYQESDGSETGNGYREMPDTLYLSIKFIAKTSGTLTIGFEGAQSDVGALPNPATVEITSSLEWQTLQWSGTWDGNGDFVLGYTGEMYVALLSVTDKPLEELRKEVSTSIEQTATNIRLLGTNIDNVNGRVTELGIDLDAANERISIYANKTTVLETELGNLTTTVTNLGFDLDAAEENISIYANKTTVLETELGNLTTTVATIRVDVDNVSSTVVSVQGDLAEAEAVAAAAAKAADEAQSTADDAYARTLSNATAISQNATGISAIAGLFDANGHLLEGSGWVLTTDYNALYSKVYAMDGALAAKAEISTSVQFDPSTGYITSDIILTADKITLNGYTTINDAFAVGHDGRVTVGGFRVTGTSIESLDQSYSSTGINGGKFRLYSYGSDATIGFVADEKKSMIGLNCSSAVFGIDSLARFEYKTATSYSPKIGVYIDVSGTLPTDDIGNAAILIANGHIAGFKKMTRRVSYSTTLDSIDNNVICVNTSAITVTLPENPNDGQEVWMISVNEKTVNVVTADSTTITGSGGSFTTNRWHIYIFDKLNSKWRYSYMNYN